LNTGVKDVISGQGIGLRLCYLYRDEEITSGSKSRIVGRGDRQSNEEVIRFLLVVDNLRRCLMELMGDELIQKEDVQGRQDGL
jgi:hypothetical protein